MSDLAHHSPQLASTRASTGAKASTRARARTRGRASTRVRARASTRASATRASATRATGIVSSSNWRNSMLSRKKESKWLSSTYSRKYRIFPPNWDMTQLQYIIDASHTIDSLPIYAKIFYRKQEDKLCFWQESNKRIKLKETYELYQTVKNNREESSLLERSDYFRKLMVYFKRLMDHFKQTPPENKGEHTVPDIHEIPQNVSNNYNDEMHYLQQKQKNAKFCLYYKDAHLTVICIPHITDAMQPIDDMCESFEESAENNTNISILKEFNQKMKNLYASESSGTSELMKLRDERCQKLLSNQCSKPFRIITFVCYVYKSGDDIPMYSMRDLTLDQTKSLIQFDKMYRKKLCELYNLQVESFQDYFNGLIEHPCHRDQCLTIHYEFQHPCSVYVKKPWRHFVLHPLRLTLDRIKYSNLSYLKSDFEVFVCKPIFNEYYLPILMKDSRYKLARLFFEKRDGTGKDKIIDNREHMHLLLDCYRFYKLCKVPDPAGGVANSSGGSCRKNTFRCKHNKNVRRSGLKSIYSRRYNTRPKRIQIGGKSRTNTHVTHFKYKRKQISRRRLGTNKTRFTRINIRCNNHLHKKFTLKYTNNHCNPLKLRNIHRLGGDVQLLFDEFDKLQQSPRQDLNHILLQKINSMQNDTMQTILRSYKKKLVNNYLLKIHNDSRSEVDFTNKSVNNLIEANTNDIKYAERILINFEYWLDFDYWCNLFWLIINDLEIDDSTIETQQWTRGQEVPESAVSTPAATDEEAVTVAKEENLQNLTLLRMHRGFNEHRVILAYNRKEKTYKLLKIQFDLKKFSTFIENHLSSGVGTSDESYKKQDAFNGVGFVYVPFKDIIPYMEISITDASDDDCKEWGFKYLFSYITETESSPHTKAQYLIHDEYKYYPMFMVAIWNGFDPLWYTASTHGAWDICQTCRVTDDRQAVSMPAMDKWLRDPKELKNFVNDTLSSNDLKHGRMLAWRIPEEYRTLFCRIPDSGHIIPIVWMLSFTKKIESVWLTELITANSIFDTTQIKFKHTNNSNENSTEQSIEAIYKHFNKLQFVENLQEDTYKYPNTNKPSTLEKTDSNELFAADFTEEHIPHLKKLYLDMERVGSLLSFYKQAGTSSFFHYIFNDGDGSVPHLRLSGVNTNAEYHKLHSSAFYVTIRLGYSLNAINLIQLISHNANDFNNYRWNIFVFASSASSFAT